LSSLWLLHPFKTTNVGYTNIMLDVSLCLTYGIDDASRLGRFLFRFILILIATRMV
jgi:hypothetical protein